MFFHPEDDTIFEELIKYLKCFGKHSKATQSGLPFQHGFTHYSSCSSYWLWSHLTPSLLSESYASFETCQRSLQRNIGCCVMCSQVKEKMKKLDKSKIQNRVSGLCNVGFFDLDTSNTQIYTLNQRKSNFMKQDKHYMSTVYDPEITKRFFHRHSYWYF